MIIKKPYAFLIKHFRLIHALLFGLLVFIFANSFNIYSFFSSYAQTHLYVNTNNLADSYVSGLMIFATILAIIISFVIYYILTMKQKSNKTYLFVFMYYLILIIYYIYIHGIFESLEQASLSVESIRAMRDISIIVILPQLALLFIILGRTLGFNLKQFDFKRDLEELEIDTSDNEEVEVTLGNDTYKIARFFRKALRLSKYFVLENKLFVIGTTSVIVLIISFAVINKLNVYKESYTENQVVNASSLQFKVNTSYITQVDKYNVVVSNGKYYILVDVFISNLTNTGKVLNRDTFRLKIGDELLLPSFNYSNMFNDIGDIFSPFELKPGEDANKLVVFEIKSQDLSNKYLFKINNLINSTTNSQYKDILIYPTNLNENKDEGNYTIPNEIKLTDSIFKDTTLHISSFEFGSKFKEKYTYELDGKTREAIYSIIPEATNKGEVVILKIKGNIKLDESVYLSKYIKCPADFFEQYGIIRYRYQGNYTNVKLKKIKVDYDVDNYSYMELTNEVLKANKIDLIVLIRGIKYTFNLK